MANTICIIGCGWLGFPLAKSFIKKGIPVSGSTTSMDKLKTLKSEGIRSYLLTFTSEGIKGNLEGCLHECDTLILNIPPGLRRNPSQDYVKQMSFLIPEIEASTIQNVLLISSTSVYDDDSNFSIITEESAMSTTSNSANQIIAVEQLFQNNTIFKTTVLRFSGLFGNDRHPAKFLSGRTQLKNGNAPVNLIHLNDCISIIEIIIEKQLWNTTFNASTTPNPTKKDYYISVCQTMNLPLPEFDENDSSKGKRIDATKLAQVLDYEFKVKL